jgi:hypothetical protein
LGHVLCFWAIAGNTTDHAELLVSANHLQNDTGYGPFQRHVGLDATSIYAAATSGSKVIALHLLACMLARSWSGPEAIAIWVELVEERKKEIEAESNPNELHGMLARATAQQSAELISPLGTQVPEPGYEAPMKSKGSSKRNFV